MRSNTDPNHSLVVKTLRGYLERSGQNLKKLKKGTPPLVRSTYFPTSLVSPEDLSFYLKFVLSLFKSKSESFLSEEVFYPFSLNIIFHLLGLHILGDSKVWSYFYKLQSLVDHFQIASKKAYIQYQQETLFSVIYTIKPPHTTAPSSSTINPSLPMKSSPLETPFVVTSIQPSATIMASFSPLILLAQLTALPQNYGQIYPFLYGTTEVTDQ